MSTRTRLIGGRRGWTRGVAAVRGLRIMLRFLARFLAVVLAAAFVVVTVAMVFVRPLGTQMLAPQTYKDVLREKKVAERLPEIAAETIAAATAAAGKDAKAGANVEREDVPDFLAGFTRADLQTLLAAALPADYVRGQAEGAIDQFFNYVNSDSPRPSVKLSLVDLKQRLSGGVLEDAYVKVLQGKPPCGADTKSLPSACCPPADRLPEVREQFRTMIKGSVKEMPESVDLFEARESAQADAVYGMVGKLRDRLRWFAFAARWSWVLPALLLLGVAVFGVRSFRGLLLWWGIPCLLAGGFAVVCALPSAAMGDWFFVVAIKPYLPPEIPLLAMQTVLGVVTAIAKVVFGAVLKVGTGLALGGLVAVVLSFFCKAKPKAVAPALPVV